MAAVEPLHVRGELPQLSGVPECKDVVKKLSQLFPVHDDQRVYVFHQMRPQ